MYLLDQNNVLLGQVQVEAFDNMPGTILTRSTHIAEPNSHYAQKMSTLATSFTKYYVQKRLIYPWNCSHQIFLVNQQPSLQSSIVIMHQKVLQSAITFRNISCSYVRLYTKSNLNFNKIRDHLERRYTNFYESRFPLEYFHPMVECITETKEQLELNLV